MALLKSKSCERAFQVVKDLEDYMLVLMRVFVTFVHFIAKKPSPIDCR